MRKTISRSILLFIAVSLFAAGTASAADIDDFMSDGCSLFPDGDLKDRALWCDCCLAHDISYWRGGTKDDRRHADEKLRDCVLERTGNKTLAKLMFDGVRAGGHPAFPTWYRWGYGWRYGKVYAPLTEQENQEMQRKLEAYTAKHPTGYCQEQPGGVK
jgi:hypothetical protein